MAERNATRHIAERHCAAQAREDVLEVLDRLFLHQRIERLEQGHDPRHGESVDDESEVDRGFAQARFPEQPLVQRRRLQRHPVDVDAGALAPRGGDVTSLRAVANRQQHRVGQHRQLF